MAKGGAEMATSKAHQKAVNKYVAANYDRINLTVEKGRKALIKEHADTMDESVNAFINRAIAEAIANDGKKGSCDKK